MAVSRLTFGKYIGRTYEEVVRCDAQYLLWCHRNLHGFYLSSEQLEEAKVKAAEQYRPRSGRRRFYQNWDDDWDDYYGPSEFDFNINWWKD